MTLADDLDNWITCAWAVLRHRGRVGVAVLDQDKGQFVVPFQGNDFDRSGQTSYVDKRLEPRNALGELTQWARKVQASALVCSLLLPLAVCTVDPTNPAWICATAALGLLASIVLTQAVVILRSKKALTCSAAFSWFGSIWHRHQTALRAAFLSPTAYAACLNNNTPRLRLTLRQTSPKILLDFNSAAKIAGFLTREMLPPPVPAHEISA